MGCSFLIHVHQSPDELPLPVIRKRMSMGEQILKKKLELELELEPSVV